jgi:hypothetical protein
MEQIEYIKEIVRLKEQNQDMEIHFYKNKYDSTNEDHEIYSVIVTDFLSLEGFVYYSKETIIDILSDIFFDYDLTNTENKIIRDTKYNELVKKVILVCIKNVKSTNSKKIKKVETVDL